MTADKGIYRQLPQNQPHGVEVRPEVSIRWRMSYVLDGRRAAGGGGGTTERPVREDRAFTVEVFVVRVLASETHRLGRRVRRIGAELGTQLGAEADIHARPVPEEAGSPDMNVGG